MICGAISQYNSTGADEGPEQLPVAAGQPRPHEGHRRVRLRRPLRRGGARDGRLDGTRASCKSREDIVEGLETFPETLLKLFKGENIGKLVLKVADS